MNQQLTLNFVNKAELIIQLACNMQLLRLIVVAVIRDESGPYKSSIWEECSEPRVLIGIVLPRA